MESSVKVALIVVGGILALALIGVFLFMQLAPVSGKTVSAQGNSVVKAVPDLVTVYFNVQTKGETAADARDKNAEIVDNAITNLVKLGLERKDIVTENFNVYPEYNYYVTPYQITGYTATHNIKVEISTNDAGKIGDIIDAGVDAGALISYINFELSIEKQNTYKAEALKLASEDAKIKAEATAEGLGKSLGSLVSVSSNNFNYNPWNIYMASDSAGSAAEAKVASTNIQPGSQDITASVSVVYKIR